MYRWTVGSFHFHQLLGAHHRRCLQDYWCSLHLVLLGQCTDHSPYTTYSSNSTHSTFIITNIETIHLQSFWLLCFHFQHHPFPDFQIWQILYWKKLCRRFDLVYRNRCWDSEKLYFEFSFGWNLFDYLLVNLGFTFYVIQLCWMVVQLILGHTQL